MTPQQEQLLVHAIVLLAKLDADLSAALPVLIASSAMAKEDPTAVEQALRAGQAREVVGSFREEGAKRLLHHVNFLLEQQPQLAPVIRELAQLIATNQRDAAKE